MERIISLKMLSRAFFAWSSTKYAYNLNFTQEEDLNRDINFQFSLFLFLTRFHFYQTFFCWKHTATIHVDVLIHWMDIWFQSLNREGSSSTHCTHSKIFWKARRNHYQNLIMHVLNHNKIRSFLIILSLWHALNRTEHYAGTWNNSHHNCKSNLSSK